MKWSEMKTGWKIQHQPSSLRLLGSSLLTHFPRSFPILLFLTRGRSRCHLHCQDCVRSSPPLRYSVHRSSEYRGTSYKIIPVNDNIQLQMRCLVRTDLANSSSPGGISRSRQRIVWFALSPELSAMTPAMSRLLTVRSRWSKEVDSGRNSARAIAPAEVRWVEERNNRLRAVLRVKAVLSDWICE